MRNRIALVLLIAACVAFVAFNLLPWRPESSPFRAGWKIWPRVIYAYQERGRDLLPASGLLAGALLIASGPFLAPILRSSRVIWWTAVVGSGMAMAAVSGSLVVMLFEGGKSPSSGMFAVILAQLLNFAGFVSIRRQPLDLGMEAPES